MISEAAVIGKLLNDPNEILNISNIVNANSFHEERHKLIFEVIQNLTDNRNEIDSFLIIEKLKSKGLLEQIGGVSYLANLMMEYTTVNIVNHALNVREAEIRRDITLYAKRLTATVSDAKNDTLDILAQTESNLSLIAEKKFIPEIKETSELVNEVVYKLLNNNGIVPSIDTGFAALNEYLQFEAGESLLLAARPSMGKTAFALSLCNNLLQQGKKVLFFSLEMSASQLLQRLISLRTHVPFDNIRKSRLYELQMKLISEEAEIIKRLNLIIDETPNIYLGDLKNKAKKIHARSNLDLIVIDYLQLIKPPKAESREREISLISSQIKGLAKELGIPIISLAQLNRGVEQRIDKTPMLSDLRESGSLENDADVVLLLNRLHFYGIETYDNMMPTKDTAQLHIAKNRNGKTGELILKFNSQYTHFTDMPTNFELPDDKKI